MAEQPGTTEWERERIHTPLLPGRAEKWEMHKQNINQSCHCQKVLKVKTFSQQGGIRTKISPSQNCMIKHYFPRCHHLFCVMANNLDVITLQDY